MPRDTGKFSDSSPNDERPARIRSRGTDPAGRPQPGAGNAGDQDRPRKSAAGPMTAEEKSAAARTKRVKMSGKRPAVAKLSSARGRQAARRGAKSAAAPRTSKKLSRKKKNDQGGKKERRAA